MVNIFISFADEDKNLVKEIEKVTKPWVRQELVKIWHKGQLLGGGREKQLSFSEMENADIILVCISSDYLFSDGLYEEMTTAVNLRNQQNKTVIPVLMRDYDLSKTPFKGITPLPSSRIPLTSSKWPSLDQAFYIFVQELERVITSTKEKKKTAPATPRKAEADRYQVGLSFAGEDRAYVEQVADALINKGISVFYDKYEQANLWGKDLYQHLNNIYKNKCEYTIIFISQHYALKLWTKHELKAAQARAFHENREYILPVRFDDTEIPGVNETILYLDGNVYSPEEVAELMRRKI